MSVLRAIAESSVEIVAPRIVIREPVVAPCHLRGIDAATNCAGSRVRPWDGALLRRIACRRCSAHSVDASSFGVGGSFHRRHFPALGGDFFMFAHDPVNQKSSPCTAFPPLVAARCVGQKCTSGPTWCACAAQRCRSQVVPGFMLKSHWKALGAEQSGTEQRGARPRPRVQMNPEPPPGRWKGVQGMARLSRRDWGSSQHRSSRVRRARSPACRRSGRRPRLPSSRRDPARA